jgi:hypothetical protein
LIRADNDKEKPGALSVRYGSRDIWFALEKSNLWQKQN